MWAKVHLIASIAHNVTTPGRDVPRLPWSGAAEQPPGTRCAARPWAGTGAPRIGWWRESGGMPSSYDAEEDAASAPDVTSPGEMRSVLPPDIGPCSAQRAYRP
jgi:hypothetical protein